PATQYRPSVPHEIPGKTKARSDIAPIGVVRFVDLLAHLHHSANRIEVGQLIIRFIDRRYVFVPQSEIQCQPLGNTPIILNEAGITPVGDFDHGISDKETPPERSSEQEGLKRRHARAGTERDIALTKAIGASVILHSAKFSSELERMISTRIRKVVQGLIGIVRALQLREVRVPAHIRKTLNGDLGKTAGLCARMEIAGVWADTGRALA